MATLVSGKEKIEVTPGKITVVTIKKNKEIANSVRALANNNTVAQFKRAFELLARFPQLAEFMTASGDLNPETVQREADRLGSDGAAREFIGTQLRAMAATNPDVALALFFPPLELTPDYETLIALFDVVRTTYDPSGLTKAEIKLIESPNDSAFWGSVESEGVIEYARKFCELYK